MWGGDSQTIAVKWGGEEISRSPARFFIVVAGAVLLISKTMYR